VQPEAQDEIDVWDEVGGLQPEPSPALPDPDSLKMLLSDGVGGSNARTYDRKVLVADMTSYIQRTLPSAHADCVGRVLHDCDIHFTNSRGSVAKFMELACDSWLLTGLVKIYADHAFKLGSEPTPKPLSSDMAVYLDRLSVLQPQNWHRKRKASIAKKFGLEERHVGALLMVFMNEMIRAPHNPRSLQEASAWKQFAENFALSYLREVVKGMNAEEEQSRQAVVKAICDYYK